EACNITFTTECQYLNNYIANSRGDYNANTWRFNSGSYLPWLYTFWNYNGTTTTAVGAPLQYLFKDSDLTYAQCVSEFGASACVHNQVWQDAISKSDWTSTASQVFIQAGFDQAGQDHTDSAQQGGFHIYRNAYLLAGDSAGGNGTSGSGVFSGNMI